LKKWNHENTLAGGGNWEFQWYTNSRENSYTEDGVLYIKPTLVADEMGEDFLYSGQLDLNGGAPADECTDPQWYGCVRTGTAESILNPIKSARIRTVDSFAFKYGKVVIRAKMPGGDWLWPSIWLMPRWNQYSFWPASGEIDIVESRGNRNLVNASDVHIGTQMISSTLHWGPAWNANMYQLTNVDTPASACAVHSTHVHGFADLTSRRSILCGFVNSSPDGIVASSAILVGLDTQEDYPGVVPKENQ
jgi:beta-glucanase (GH16 family)